MDIRQYTGYFHDGTVIDIKHKTNNLEIFLESCQIPSDEFPEGIALSEERTLKGKLCLMGIKSIKVNDKEYKGILRMEYDDGEILRFRIDNRRVFLFIEWKNFPPKTCTSDLSEIEIEAEKIYWENIPDLPDNC